MQTPQGARSATLQITRDDDFGINEGKWWGSLRMAKAVRQTQTQRCRKNKLAYKRCYEVSTQVNLCRMITEAVELVFLTLSGQQTMHTDLRVLALSSIRRRKNYERDHRQVCCRKQLLCATLSWSHPATRRSASDDDAAPLPRKRQTATVSLAQPSSASRRGPRAPAATTPPTIFGQALCSSAS